MGQLGAHQERHLGARADHQPAVLVEPAARAVGLQRGVGDPRGLPGAGTVAAAAASPAATSPTSPWVWATTLRLRLGDPGCRRWASRRAAAGAPAPRAASGSKTAGSTSYSTSIRAAARWAAATDSATTAATRWPRKRTTSSSIRVSSGSSSRLVVAGGGVEDVGDVAVREDEAYAGRRPRRGWCRCAVIRAWACGLCTRAMCSTPVVGQVERVGLGAGDDAGRGRRAERGSEGRAVGGGRPDVGACRRGRRGSSGSRCSGTGCP